MIAMDRSGAERTTELNAGRAELEQAMRLAAHLAPADRALMNAVYERGMSVQAFARAARRSPGAVRRRLDRLITRISSPPFRLVLRESRQWPAQRRRIAELVILQGLGARAAAARVNMTTHQIRREIDRVRALIEAATVPQADQRSIHNLQRGA